MASPFSLSQVDVSLSEELTSTLEVVEEKLMAATHSTDPFISEVAGHLAAAGGKRFRPLLVAMSSQLGHATEQVVDAAVVVELTHLATLYHDDVMDEAPKRRGVESVNARWDNTLAILTGDFLFARASQILADLGTDAVRLQAETFERLVSGQIHETVGPADGVDPVQHHINVLADKTGSLISTSAVFGGMFAALPNEALAALKNFGEAIGVAFQIADAHSRWTNPSGRQSVNSSCLTRLLWHSSLQRRQEDHRDNVCQALQRRDFQNSSAQYAACSRARVVNQSASGNDCSACDQHRPRSR